MGLFIQSLLVEIFNSPVVVNASLSIGYDGKPIHSNWGDDINYWLLKEISSQPVIMYSQSVINRLFRHKHVLGIGSILGMCSNRRSIVWGSGILDSTIKTIESPAEIRAVRGPLTRKKLLEMGIECPAVYGDPAMLVKQYYNPNISKKYKLGVISHYSSAHRESAFEAFQALSDVHHIDIANYGDWHSFIDEILSCEAIVSSSLHGLIIAETYGIPSLWIEFPVSDLNHRIKYHDFYLSIGKDSKPIKVDKIADLELINKELAKWKPGYIDLGPLIENTPFKLKK